MPEVRQDGAEILQSGNIHSSMPTRSSLITQSPTRATFLGLTQAQMNKAMGQGIGQMQLCIINIVFLGGLQEDIHNRVVEEASTKPKLSVVAAREIESILNDKKKDKDVFVNSINGD
jgi:hypothetical protein